MDEPLLRLELTGHPAVRATHGKTLEFSVDAEITERATCVVGVAARAGDDVPAALAGPVRITMTAGGHEVVVDAVANPGWRPGGAAIVRRSTERRPDTLATQATLVAADLPRAFVAAAAVPGAPIAVRVDRLPRRPDGRAGLVLAWVPPSVAPGPWLAAEVAAADAVVADDRDAARVLADVALAGDPHGNAVRSSRAPLDGERPATPRPGDDRRPARAEVVTPAAAEAGLLDGSRGRVLVLATAGLPGPPAGSPRPPSDAAAPPGGTLPGLLRAGEVAVEVVGLPPGLAAAAASPWRGPVQLAGPVAAGRLDALLRAVPAGSGVAGETPLADLPKLVEVAAARRPGATGVLYDPAGGTATWGPVTDWRPARTGGSAWWFLDGTDAPTGLDPELGGLLGALLADGVSARSLATALAGRPGWSRRRAYDAVHALRPSD